ncbi:MAG: hypothetical protein LUE86_14280 [Clostridiales bacterium]|nr:hypothetical protein [Clostridiales bacterium]
MATSSIFHNFTITDEKAAEQFLDALDKAAEQSAWKPKNPFKPPIRDPEVIRAKMAKRKEHA